MAQLTTASKVLLSAAFLGVAGAALWRLDAFNWASKAIKLNQEKREITVSAPGKEDPGEDLALGTPAHPLKVSLVSFHGYAPGLIANGSSLKTQKGSIYDRLGISVEFVIQDDVPTLVTLFEGGITQCAWRTSDFWAQEHPNLRSAEHDGKAILIVDNTQGADAIITNRPDIQSVEDLAGKSLALLQFTPSHGLALDAIENSSLSARKKESIKYVFLNADEGTSGVRAAFEAKKVDAAAIWDPDLSLALKASPEAHVIYSTAVATNLIYDVMVCDQKYLSEPANQKAFQSFVTGWFEGVARAKEKPDEATAALVKNEKMFDLLAKKEGPLFIQGLFKNLLLTGLEDNIRILGLAGGTNHYERVYKKFDQIYRTLGTLANPSAPVISPQESFDYRFIKALSAAQPQATVEAKKPEFVFSEQEKAQATTHHAVVTKPVLINFPSGSALLTKKSQTQIDKEVVPLIESNGSAYFAISGNTDGTGARAANVTLSMARARAVHDYLAKEWEMDSTRFEVIGNGPDHPLCSEKKPEEGLSAEDCRALNRTTRLSVFAKH